VYLDGDGTTDLISGSWPGELFFFKGQGKGQFDAPVKLKDKHGKTINIGGGKRPDSGGMIVIAGDAKFEKGDKGQDVIVYEGERIVVPEGKSAGITGTASAVHAVDWDDDGKLDLLVGEIGGHVYLIPNEGTPKAWAFGKEQPLKAGGEEIKVDGGDAGPFAVDWDRDGRTDLLVGAGDGSVWLYRNVGSAKKPRLAAGVCLVSAGDTAYGADVPKEPRRGTRAKVCAVDWDRDGRLDLLVGDIATQKPDLPEPTPQQKAEQDQARKDLEPLQKRHGELISRVFSDKPPQGAEKEKVEKEMTELQEKMGKLRDKIPPEFEQHGWVWLFRRKPAATGG